MTVSAKLGRYSTAAILVFLGMISATPVRAAAAQPLGAAVDTKALASHIRKSFSLPAGVEIEIQNIKPSAVPGFLSGDVQFRYQGKTQDQSIAITQDGRRYVLSALYPLAPSPIHGLVGPADQDPGAPKVYVTEDKKYFMYGEFRDLTVDPDAANMAKIRLDGVPFRGASSAPVALVEYSDLQCPYCRGAHQMLEKQLLQSYGGKVKWVFKYFPLTTIHPWALNAAIASACAARQKADASWDLDGFFFEHQADITPANIREKALEFVKKLDAKIDVQKFEACYDKQETKDAVQADVHEGESLGVNSTPTFFVNGRMFQGFKDFDAAKAVIDQMLAAKAAPGK